MKANQIIVICCIISFGCEFTVCRTNKIILNRPQEQQVRDARNKIYKKWENYKIATKLATEENSMINITAPIQEYSYDDNSDFGDPAPIDNNLPGNEGWNQFNSMCRLGQRQSPIDINLIDVKMGNIFEPLQIEGLDQLPSSITAINNGHSLVIRFIFADDFQVRLTSGPLGKIHSYIVDSVHWHWGENDFSGSEHTISGKRFSAEGHIVSYNSAYNSLAEASGKPNGLAVLGIVYKWSFFSTYNPFINLVRNVYKPLTSYEETNKMFPLKDLLPSDTLRVFSYEGSLTTPPCTEEVTWMISIHPMLISFIDLTYFRRMTSENEELILENIRPLQNLNGRSVIFQ